MASIELKYGGSHFYFEFDEYRFKILETDTKRRPLTDIEISERLDEPLGTVALEDLVGPGEKVLIVVPDATREAACGQVINLLIRRLIANGTAAFDISIIFATGIHRPVTEDEKKAILTPFIHQRIKSIDHSPRDISRIVRLGGTDDGVPVELNRALVENQHVILIGGISFHYFAGFTGGRKLVCPGLASSRTISRTHKLAFDCETMSRRGGVGTGLLDGNAVHEAFTEAASKANITFCISTIDNDGGELVEMYCGDWIGSHRQACREFAANHTIRIKKKRPLVVASCGGRPFDINMIQAHKTLEAASHACTDGGTIVLLAECADGLGREDFLKWFEPADSGELARVLCENYQVNGQTAWSLLKMTEKFDVRIVTGLSEKKVEKMRMSTHRSPASALAGLAAGTSGYIIPFGSKVRVLSQAAA